MKKKDSLTKKDKEDWKNFLKDKSHIPDKDQVNQSKNQPKDINMIYTVLH